MKPRWLIRLPEWSLVAVLVLLLGVAWAATYLAGGTRTVLPHLFYVPIVLAVVPFRMRGGVVVGVAATLLSGPLLPLDVATGTAQSTAAWLARGAFFVGIGALGGLAERGLRTSYHVEIKERIRQDVDGHGADPDAPSDLAVAERIADVLTARAFHPVFQPIYALDDGRLLAVEALTRFDAEPVQPPNVWFDQATQAGRGEELELGAMEEALAAGAALPDDVAISLNASPRTLAHSRLFEVLDQRGRRPVIVEVTEHAIIDDYGLLDTVRTQLRARGIRVAVDDAGAGFASLRHIVRLAPEIIKLDPSLTQDIRYDPVRQALADSLLTFARQTRSEVIVEGIEQSSDLFAWRDLGAHGAQGYLLARPGPLPVVDQIDLGSLRPAHRLKINRS